MKLQELKDLTNGLTNFNAFKEVCITEDLYRIVGYLPQKWKNFWFINKGNIKHDNKYDYSKVKYIDKRTKIKITCPIHGEFEQIPSNHMLGYGCKGCGRLVVKNKTTMTTEQFIEKANIKYKNKYDYSKVRYINSDTKVIIICPIHGEFEQTPKNHFASEVGCHKCSKLVIKNKTTMTTEQFIEKANMKHGNKYDYSKVRYINKNTEVTIICKEHGEFEQTPKNHFASEIGCHKCNKLVMATKNTMTTEQFIKKAKKIHGNKYNYSKVKYINKNTKVTIICDEHGEFNQNPKVHLKNHGCHKCGILVMLNKNTMTTEQFIEKAKKVHGDKYNYSRVEYKHSCEKVTIICDEHGSFEQTPTVHTRGIGCPKCNESKGEKRIAKFLDKHNINYIREYKFKRLGQLRFDFYLPDLNTCIEFDGIQHFVSIKYWGGIKQFEKTKENDKIKNKFCEDNNIKLIRIKYTDYNKIEEILSESLSLL